MSLSLGIGLGLTHRFTDGAGGGDPYALGGVSPVLVLDYANDVYKNPSETTFGALHTFTRASTGTYFDISGVMQTAAIDEPRLDHDPYTHEALGIPIEDVRGNRLKYSNDFTNPVYTKDNLSLTTGQTSLDGTGNATKITNDTTNGLHRFYQAVTDNNNTRNIYAKADTCDFISLSPDGTGGAVFNLATGVVESTLDATAEITPAGDGWYRISVTTTSGGVHPWFMVFIGETASQAIPNTSYIGTTKSLFISYAQNETALATTSYIDTVASTLTTSPDSLSVLLSSFGYNTSEGTIVIEVAGQGGQSFSFDDGTEDERIISHTGNTFTFYVEDGAVQVNLGITGFTDGEFSTLAGAYKLNDFAASVDGGAVSTDNSGTTPSPTILNLGNSWSGSSILEGNIKNFRYFDQRLSDVLLQEAGE